MKKVFILSGVIIVVGLVLFWPTFNLAVFGDNWMVFWGGKVTLGTVHKWDSWVTYFSPYGMSHLILYLVQKFFGYSGSVLYILSFLSRSLAVLGLFIFLKNRGFPILSVFIGSLLFMITPIGLETTDWAFQMVSYLSIFFLFVTCDLVFGLNSWKKVVMCLLFSFLAITVNPIRAHGTILLIGWVILVEMFLNKKGFKFLFGFLAALIALLAFMSRKYTFGDPENTFRMIEPGLNLVFESFKSKNPSLIYNLLVSIGNGIIPDYFVSKFLSWQVSYKILGSYRPLIDTLLVPVVVLFFLYGSKFYLLKEKRLKKIMGVAFVINLFFLVGIYKILGLPPYSLGVTQILVAIVFVFNLPFFTILDYAYKYFNNVRINLFCLGLSTLFLILPWVHSPTSQSLSYHRYLIYSASVLPVLLASFHLSLSKNIFARPLKLLSQISILLILFSFFRLTSLYIKQAEYRHGEKYVEAVWNNLDTYLGSVDFNGRKTLFYFVADQPDRIHEAVIFGFGFHAGARYNIWKQSDLPTITNDIHDLKSMLTDGKASKKYIAQEYKYPKKDVFILSFKGTDVKRLDLKDILP